MNPITARALSLIADAVKLLANDNVQDDQAAAVLLRQAAGQLDESG